MTYELITSSDQLRIACDQFSKHSVIAVDTEFKRETTYYPIPCLFQLASDDATVCIDPFEIDDLSPLDALFNNEDIIKIFHASRQDLEIFYFLFKQLPQPIFDTQIAASMLGFPAQVGYAKLVSSYLDIELDKSLTRADWEKRPISKKQLEYAANDVIYLLQVYKKQVEALKECNRVEWPDLDNKALLDISLYQPDPSQAWKKLKNYPYLTNDEQKISSAIALWREELAISHDRPRKFIFDNPVITEVASKQPTTLKQFSELEDIPAFVTKKYAQKMVELVNEALQSDVAPAKNLFVRLSEGQSKQVKALQKIIKEVAEIEKIEPNVICSKKDIEKLVQGSRSLPIFQGWRYDLVGKKLTESIS